MKDIKRRHFALIAIAVCLMLFVSACGEDDHEINTDSEKIEQEESTDNPFGETSGGKYLSKKKFVNTSLSDNYDLYIEFIDKSYYKYYALKKGGNESDTISNNGRFCSFLRKYYANNKGTNVEFDGPKSKWIYGAYHTPLSAIIDKDFINLELSLYLEYHKRNPKMTKVKFERL